MVSQSPNSEIAWYGSGDCGLVSQDDESIGCWLPTDGVDGWKLKMSFAIIDGTRKFRPIVGFRSTSNLCQKEQNEQCR